MNPALQETLLQLFEHVHNNPDSLPVVPVDEWDEGSTERRLLESFRGMAEQVQQRIHQLRLADQQVREQEELYHSAFDATNDGLFIGDLDGTIVEVNSAACQMYGYSYAEMIGLTGLQLIHPVSHPQLEELIAMLPSAGTRTQLVALRKDGSTFHTEGHLSTFIYKGKPYLLSVGHDVTERVKAEQQLREHEEQYRSVFEATYDGLIISNVDGFVVEVNPAFCSMYGYTREELLGLHVGVLAAAESLPVLDEVLERRKTGMNYQTVVAQAMRKDGTAFSVESHGTTFTYRGQPHTLGIVRDTTERIEAEQKLREREEQYRSIFEATDDGLVINDLNGLYIEANPAFCKMLGYTHEELIGLDWNQTTYPEYYPVMDESTRVTQGGGEYQAQGLARRKDGSPLPVEGHSTPFIYKGQPHVLKVMRDITQRVQAEQQLHEKEEQYRSIFEATSDGLIIVDLYGFIVQANPSACQMYGYTYEEFIGLQGTAITAPDSLHLLTEALQTIKLGEQLQTPIRSNGLRKDGTTFLSEGYGTPFMYKGKQQILAVVRDVTEQVKTEQELREREEQYRSIFEATYDGIDIFDSDGYFVEANPAFCSMFGYTREELIGMHASVLVAPQYLPVLDEVLKTLGTSTGYQTVVGQGLRKDGTTIYTESHGTPFIYKGKLHLLGVSRDITERVEAERQLREREEQYRAIFEATSDALEIGDLEDGHIIEANPAACNMFGYSYEELIGLPASATTHPDSLHLVVEGLQAVRAGHHLDVQGLGVRKDGTPFYVEARGTPFTYKGKPHLLTVSRDITERVEAEQQLREKEEQYRGIFEAASDAMFITTLEAGVIVEANPAACRMLGYSYEELIDLSPAAIVHPASLSQAADDLQALQAGQAASGTMVLLRKDGTTFPTEGRSTIFAYKGRPHVLAVLRDITRQVEAENRLRERELQYRSIFEATYDGLVISDRDGYIVEVNPAFCGMYGYSREELIGVHSSALAATEYLAALDEVLETLKAGRNYQTMVAQSLRKDGTMFYTESQGTTLSYRGQPHALGVVRDITERVEAQQLLEQRVEERTRELASLLEISHSVASTLQLKPLLGLILDQLKTVVDYTGSAITTLEGQDVVLIATRGPQPEEHLLHRHFSLKHMEPIWEVISRGETVIIDNVRGDSPFAQAYRESVDELMETTLSYIRAWMAVPLMLKERVIGMLSLTHSQPNFYTQRSAELAVAIANQAAVAIENAQLYEQAQELAAVEERQRLARELHDSVSQALYGISLGVHTARMQLDRDPRELAESLDYVLELAEAALIEMRALIFELRPESLEAEGLVTALAKQAAALQARQNIAVNTDLCAEPDFPLKVKQDLYRIAQEALHNTVKHAQASKIALRLHQTSEAVILEVCDNGRGFDATASFPGHLGLHSMQERVRGLGGELRIESAPGQGTCIRVRVPGRDER